MLRVLAVDVAEGTFGNNWNLLLEELQPHRSSLWAQWPACFSPSPRKSLPCMIPIPPFLLCQGVGPGGQGTTLI